MAELIPALNWKLQGSCWIAWINDVEFYSIKPVAFVDDDKDDLQFEVRLNHVATGTSELVAVGYNREKAFSHARTHVGDDG